MPEDQLDSSQPSALGQAQLRRLRTLMDVLFALMLWRFASYLPQPEESEWTAASLFEFLRDHSEVFEIVAVGVVLVVVYWLQNNAQFGNLSHTDNRHTSFAIVQIFLLLLYSYTITLGIAFEGDRLSLALQSASAAALGLVAVAGWSYAMRGRRLLDDEITDEQARSLQINTLAEPATALVTLGAAWWGSTAWTLAWLTYPLMRMALVRRMR